jgi:hopanoid-associated phosphorylase
MGDVGRPLRRIGVVTGLAFEAACLRRAISEQAGVQIACVAGDYKRAYRAATQFAESGCDLLVSFGFAGGLDPGLKAGDIVLSDLVVAPSGQRLAAAGGPTQRLAEAAGRDGVPLTRGAVLGVQDPVALSKDKLALHERFAAIAVDMESLGVAEAASFAARPFLSLRVIIDAAGRDVPPAAVAAMGATGRLRPLALFGSLIRTPSQLPDLLRLAGDAAVARRSLRRAAQALGAAFRTP